MDATGTIPLHRQRWLKIVINLVVAGVCFWGATAGVDSDRLAEILAAASWPLLLTVGALTVAANLVKCTKLGLLLRPERKLPYRVLFGAETVSILTDVLFPFRLLELIKAFVVSRTTSVPLAMVLGAEVVEKAVEFAVLLGLAVLTSFLSPLPAWLAPARWLGLAVLAATLLLIVLARRQLLGEGSRTGGQSSLWQRVKRLLGQLSDGMRVASVSGRTLLAVLVLTLVEWAVLAGSVYLAGASLQIALSPLAVVGFLVANALSFAFPASSGGSVGIYELVGVKTLVLLAGMASADALALVLAMHLVLLVFGALSGVIGLQLVGLNLLQLRRLPEQAE